MQRPTRFLAFLPALVVALSASFLLAGCDTNSEADEADREKLLGSWIVTGLSVDGANEDATIRTEYPNSILFRLRLDDADRELFLVRSRADNGEALLQQQGTFDVDAEDSELQLESAFGVIELFYDFGSATATEPRRVELEADSDNDGQQLLALFQLEGFGDVESVSITIERQ